MSHESNTLVNILPHLCCIDAVFCLYVFSKEQATPIEVVSQRRGPILSLTLLASLAFCASNVQEII